MQPAVLGGSFCMGSVPVDLHSPGVDVEAVFGRVGPIQYGCKLSKGSSESWAFVVVNYGLIALAPGCPSLGS